MISKFSHITFGADPELFIRRDGEIIGSEKVIGAGIKHDSGNVIVDGVQVELNPRPSTCRSVFMSYLQFCLAQLSSVAGASNLDFSRLVEVNVNEYHSLSDACKKFGCKPSFNVNAGYPEVATVDPSEYLLRSAGGHFHFGANGYPDVMAVLKNPERLVPVLDLLVGNTGVLLDRDEGNIERRKNYGRAGEYRTPEYGIEYRTLSNFWLQSPVLCSLMLGLGRHAVDIVLNDLDKELMSMVDYSEVVTAINNNDYDLALANFNKIKDFLVDTVDPVVQSDTMNRYPVDRYTVNGLLKLAEDGIDSLGTNYLSNWSNRVGFHDFISSKYEV